MLRNNNTEIKRLILNCFFVSFFINLEKHYFNIQDRHEYTEIYVNIQRYTLIYLGIREYTEMYVNIQRYT